jgi:hypothetical protein
VRRADNLATFMCRLPQPPGTLRACNGIALLHNEGAGIAQSV